ncbi:response regulator [Enterovibrio sp. ZSDZ35]|uniref:histidine kinase n=1 Tax=Enterovibrio qingdaonensis TaxID=2899818 RepID=A0ABT5QJX3_9GAMM|nr:hybrid sensor histidine kinase/response regulator [Enterovibrio sp. ZSDZ35]MDD1781159.1 response regulator [Enterovibrio sp. ZSDZ35]
MSDWVSISSENSVAILLVSIALFVMLWASYFVIALTKKRSGLSPPLYVPYTLYTMFISVWILSNAYFQSYLLVETSRAVALWMAMIANIASGLAFCFAYLFSCRLRSEQDGYKISRWQWCIFSCSVLTIILTNTSPGLSVVSVDVEDIGQFIIHFGAVAWVFFACLFLVIVLTLRNFILSSKSPSMLKRVKSSYMVFGMVAFIFSTFVAHFAIPVLFNDFSVTWVPPALSIVEALMVGYALLSDRFYSFRYVCLQVASFSSNAMLYIIPATLITNLCQNQNIAPPIAAATLISGLFWLKTHAFFLRKFNHLIYHQKGNPVENISKLTNDFRYSTELAIEKLNTLLNAKSGQIQAVGKNAENVALLLYFQGNRTILVRDELEYQVSHSQSSNKDALKQIANEMRNKDISLVLPITDEQDDIVYLYVVSKNPKESLITSEEILGLQKLFAVANRFIVTEQKIRTSHVLAGSIAHEIRNPLTKINYHFERINADMFGIDKDEPHSIASPEMQKIYHELVEGKKAVQLGNRFIDAMLSELNGEGISTSLFKTYSAAELTSQAINDFSFNSEQDKQRVVFNKQSDFVFHGSDTLYSFVIFNLLKNAVYYFDSHPNSNVNIRFGSTTEKHQVRVIDTGPGISKEQQAHIFDEYYSQGKSKGNGLGLAYCRRVMESFGGNIEVRSVPGVFTEFVLTFPSLDTSNLNAAVVKNLTQNLNGKSCLVVSDSNTYALLSSELLLLGTQTTWLSENTSIHAPMTTRSYDFILIDTDHIEFSNDIIKRLRSGELGHQAQITPIWLLAQPNTCDPIVDNYIISNLAQGKIDSINHRESFLHSLDTVINDGGLHQVGCLIGKRVLVVDDMQVNRLLVQGYLATEGVDVVHASSGQEAILKAKMERLDLILMDIRMPGMDGIEATKSIRQCSQGIPVIALSGEYTSDTLLSIDDTMDDHLVKPVTKQQLVKMLIKWLVSPSHSRLDSRRSNQV